MAFRHGRFSIFVALVGFALVTGCGGEEAAETGSNVVDACTDVVANDVCPAGTTLSFDAQAVADCGGSVGASVDLTSQSGEVSGRCGSSGECSFVCVPPAPCCGGEEWTETSYSCETPCAALNCSCEDRCGPIQDGDCEIDCGSCAVGQVCSAEGTCEVGCEAGAELCAGSCCGSGEVCYLNECCDRVSNCKGQECGSDACGGLCSAQDSIPGCTENETCQNGVCTQTCLLGEQRCFQSGGVQKIQECKNEGGLLGWYVVEACLTDEAPNCLLSNTGAQCVACTIDEDCQLGQTCSDNLCTGECVPQCEGLNCGGDQCGGSCPDKEDACGEDWGCVDGTCVDPALCDPACDDKLCGEDGCGGSCGECAEGEACNAGTCCETSCEGQQCGVNGCGQACGECGDDQVCDDAEQCVCAKACAGAVCGPDGCGGVCGNCPIGAPDCVEGACQCTPNCVAPFGGDKVCGGDGCGGSCGECSPSSGQVCDETIGACVDSCTASCTGSDCGSDGCGGSCGTCGSSQECDTNGACVSSCEPQCSSFDECGADGCGGLCGECSGDSECTQVTNGYVCQEAAKPCGSVNLAQGVDFGSYPYMSLPVAYNEVTSSSTNWAMGVWVRGEQGENMTDGRTVVSSETGFSMSLDPYNQASNAWFYAQFPYGKTGEVLEFASSGGIPGYGGWWKNPEFAPQWIAIGFVKVQGVITWCASSEAASEPLGISEIDAADVGKMYLDEILGDGTTDDSGASTRVGVLHSGKAPLRASVGGVRVMTLPETIEPEPSTACKDLYTLMSAEPEKVPENSGWTVVRDWALNKFEAGGSFSEYTNEGQPMSLQPAQGWSEPLNFKSNSCPVPY